MEHASAIRMRDSERRAVESSSVLVRTVIALSLCLGLSKPTCEPPSWLHENEYDSLVVTLQTSLCLQSSRRVTRCPISEAADVLAARFYVREITNTLDKGRNAVADALASAAAAHHAASPALTESATKRQRVALSTQMFVADLLFLTTYFFLLSMSEVDVG